MARWVRRRDRAGRVLAIASQAKGVLSRYGVTREEADHAAWTIDGEGRLEGAAAVNRVWREMGGAWSAVAVAYRFRPVAMVEEAAYRWFASNRSRFKRFGVQPECDEPLSECE
jgi:predicted DCC family thiol-disulfide oxidoreductase YuxK